MSQSTRRPLASPLVALVAVLAALAPGAPAEAQELKERIAIAMEMITAGAREILEEEMILTDKQKEAFWPLYDEYAAKRREIGQRYVRLIGAYLDRYQAGSLTDDDADLILDVYFDIEMDTLQLQQRYVRRFRKIMPGIKVARFFQLESKIRAEVDQALALAIPLADPR
ncbi:MAG: hypothetical protein AAFX10_02650 [Pseudomonadota bacterium]